MRAAIVYVRVVWIIEIMLILGAPLQANHLFADEPAVQELQAVAAAPSDTRLNTPEAALREFLVAMMDGDSRRIVATTLPDPDEGILMASKPIPARVRAAAMAGIQQMKRLNVGDKVELPGGQTMVLEDRHVNANEVQIKVLDAEIPFSVVKVKSEWYVDTAPLIAGRKAAAAARKAAGQPQISAPAKWEADKTVGDRLAEETQFAGYSIKPPRDYQPEEENTPQGKSLIWQTAARNDGSKPLLLLSVLTLPPEQRTFSKVRQLESVLKYGIDAWHDGVQCSTFEAGEINGLPFVRCRWKGISKSTSKLPGRPRQGIVYAGTDGDRGISILSYDSDPHAVDSLKMAEAAILSLRKK